MKMDFEEPGSGARLASVVFRLLALELHAILAQEELDKMVPVWDAKFLLAKQRYPGSRQNASRHLWFHYGSLQFHTRWAEEAYDYLE